MQNCTTVEMCCNHCQCSLCNVVRLHVLCFALEVLHLWPLSANMPSNNLHSIECTTTKPPLLFKSKACAHNTLVQALLQCKGLNSQLLQVYVHRIRKYIGAYMVHLKGKVDAIVMSAGVGENSPSVRKLLLADLEVRQGPTFVRMLLLVVKTCHFNNLAVSVLLAKS